MQHRVKVWTLLVLLIALASPHIARCQFGSELKRFSLSLFLPPGYVEGLQLRELIRTKQWAAYRNSVGDKTAMNTLFDLSFELCHTDLNSTLLASAVSVLDHRTIPIKFLFGSQVDIPLTIESQLQFEERTANLPSRIYSDSLEDRDKLQHFYFSAYLKRTLGASWLSTLLGSIVETGENLFIIGGEDDPRDRKANQDGISFESQLEEHGYALPIESLKP